MRIFGTKTVKNRLSVGGSASELPLASGGDFPRCYSSLLLQLFAVRFWRKRRFITPKKNKITAVNGLLLRLPKLFHLFLTSICWRRRKNVSCPRAQSTLAMPLPVPVVVRQITDGSLTQRLKRSLCCLLVEVLW